VDNLFKQSPENIISEKIIPICHVQVYPSLFANGMKFINLIPINSVLEKIRAKEAKNINLKFLENSFLKKSPARPRKIVI